MVNALQNSAFSENNQKLDLQIWYKQTFKHTRVNERFVKKIKGKSLTMNHFILTKKFLHFGAWKNEKTQKKTDILPIKDEISHVLVKTVKNFMRSKKP